MGCGAINRPVPLLSGAKQNDAAAVTAAGALIKDVAIREQTECKAGNGNNHPAYHVVNNLTN